MPKTKLMVSGRTSTAEDKAAITTGDEQVENVNVFSFNLGSVICHQEE